MRLKEYFNKYNTPIAAFARKSGVSIGTIFNILRGVKELHLSIALKIEKATEGQVTCSELLSEEKNKNA